jgi:Domain of unknown function (DUF4304)
MSTKAIIACLDEELVPAGFVRQGTTWNRQYDKLIEVVDVQRSKAGDTVTLNVGVLERDVYYMCWGHEPEPFVEEPFCTVRARIGQLLGGKDQWWNVKDASVAEEMAACVTRQAVPFLVRMHSLEEMSNWLAAAGAPSKGAPLPSVCFAVLQSLLGHTPQACLALADVQSRALGAWKARVKEVSVRIGCD